MISVRPLLPIYESFQFDSNLNEINYMIQTKRTNERTNEIKTDSMLNWKVFLLDILTSKYQTNKVWAIIFFYSWMGFFWIVWRCRVVEIERIYAKHVYMYEKQPCHPKTLSDRFQTEFPFVCLYLFYISFLLYFICRTKSHWCNF